ncbi:MAG: hypothetical protein PWP08_411 [Methanofollis sp.]|nr:hypothetical protein [Methanofollis sp.]
MKPGVLIIFCLLLAFSAPVLAAPERTIMGTPQPGGEFVVTLNVSGIAVGGIVENIPAGFVYVSTTHPPGRVSVADRQVSFALLGDDRVSYRLRAPAAGSGAITGFWEDFVTGENGTVAPTQITAAAAEPPETGISRPSTVMPGFSVPCSLFALTVVLFFRRRSE